MKFPSHLNCDGKIVSEMGPCFARQGASDTGFQLFSGVTSVYRWNENIHNIDVLMIAMTSQITNVSIVYLTICSGADQGKHQSSASLAFVKGIHR